MPNVPVMDTVSMASDAADYPVPADPWGACRLWLVAGLLSWLPSIPSWGTDVDYLRDVKPILSEHCYSCHGSLKQDGGLRLDTVPFARGGGNSGAALVPGDVAASSIYQRVASTDPELRMPLEGRPLSDHEQRTLRTWIESGALGTLDEQPERDPREHWSFLAPRRGPLPATVRAPGRNMIDLLVNVEMDRRGIVPLAEASASVLLRRLYLDLVGVPPSESELSEFLADTRPEAYDRVVDQLLADPRYGERWGRHWMDIWRYSDWYGRRMVPDPWNSAPQIWHWRDWIVRSLNRDLGYDHMLSDMLAADELAPDDPQRLVATGFLVRNWYALNPNDWMRSNVEHTAKAFLGLTLHCAHCHDHKYDPITQSDYFAFRSFFEPLGVRQDRLAGQPDPGPFPEYNYSALRKIVREGIVRVYDQRPQALAWFYSGGDERNHDKSRTYAPQSPAFLGAMAPIQAVRLSPEAAYPGLRPAILATMVRDLQRRIEEVRVPMPTAIPSQRAPASANRSDLLEQAELDQRLALQMALEAELASLQSRHRSEHARYQGVPDSKLAPLRHEALRAQDSATRAAAVLAVAESFLQVCRLEEQAAEGQSSDPRKHEQGLAQAHQQWRDARQKFISLTDSLTVANDARNGAALNRNPHNNHAASRDTLAAILPLTDEFPRESSGRRSALARWITDRTNPLTARVAANHIWMRHFHAPLVASVVDFGRNGAAPTHPELLDWLACEFMDHGWSMQHMHRLIVTSATYRRASSGYAQSPNLKLDPENRFLWRMNVGNMESEVVRDSLLSVSELLEPQMGGQELENNQTLTTYRRSLYYSCNPESDGKSDFGRLFDAPDANDCYRRSQSVVPQQALALTNSELVHLASTRVANRLSQAVLGESRHDSHRDADRSNSSDSTTDPVFVERVFAAILSRAPTAQERSICLELLHAQASLQHPSDRSLSPRATLARVLFNHNDFVSIR